jgi:hypothetical protein
LGSASNTAAHSSAVRRRTAASSISQSRTRTSGCSASSIARISGSSGSRSQARRNACQSRSVVCENWSHWPSFDNATSSRKNIGVLGTRLSASIAALMLNACE